MKAHEIAAWMSTILRVTGSTVVGKYSAVLVGGTGVTGGLGSIDDDEDGEQVDDAETYGGLGLVSRPRVPDTAGDKLAAEAMALRKGGLLYPLAWRDLRLHARFPNPKPGTTALVGYGGGFLSFDDVPGSVDGSTATFYCPYAFSGGVPTKAHVIVMDPINEAVSITHGDGAQIMMLKNKEIMMVVDDATWLDMKPDTFKVQAKDIGLIGTVTIGNPATAAPLLAGPGVLPSTRLLYSQT